MEIDERKDSMKDIKLQHQERCYLYFLNKMSLLSKPIDLRIKRREIARLLTKKNTEKKYGEEGSCC